jgi:alpha-beta hydrolase superfamily lysophospholipase
MKSRTIKFFKLLAILVVGGVVAVVGMRAWDAERSPPLAIWHTYVPKDLKAGDLAKIEWNDYLKAEKTLFDDVRTEVTQKLEPEDRIPSNRYFDGSPIYPGNFSTDWNRSYILEPVDAPVGAVVLLHGLTDSPYSLRHIARRYRDLGFVAVAIRLPGHGTVPSGLTDVQWEDWSEATRLAVREARRRIGPARPLHLIGFSNGGALAMKYALDAIDKPGLTRPDRIVLISPMIGITAFARFAGLFGWPAIFPRWAKAAWLGVVPEFNPFKYNSFPVNGARQSSQLTRELQDQIAREARANRLAELPPILTFQSLVDFTVSTRAIVTALYANLPANGSELVLFDLNRSARLGPMLRPTFETKIERLLPSPPRQFRTTVITNAGSDTYQVVERIVDAGATTELVRPLELTYPPEVYSLSHVAVPFPMEDSLYGMNPDASDEFFGVHLGSIAARGEVGALIVTLDSLIRMSSNPFFPFMLERIEAGIPLPGSSGSGGSSGAGQTPVNPGTKAAPTAVKGS